MAKQFRPLDFNTQVIANYREAVQNLIQIVIYKQNGHSFKHKKQDLKISIVNLSYSIGVDIKKYKEELEPSKHIVSDILYMIGTLSIMFSEPQTHHKTDYADYLGRILRFFEVN